MARTTKGRVYTRGKKGYYYLQYYVRGEEYRVALKNDDGKNITTVREAKRAAEKILNPFFAREEAARIEKVSEALATAEKKAEAALARLKETALAGGNIFAELMETVRVASLGQITKALYEVGGKYRRNM